MIKANSKPLESIPSVGKAVAKDLRALGYKMAEDLRGEDPERMYEKLCKMQGMKIDRCMLYTFRCAVYYASRKSHDPEKLKWWNWKD